MRSEAGPARETIACVDVGQALGYVTELDAALSDRMRKIVGTLVNLSRR